MAVLGLSFLPSIRPLAVPNDFGDELIPAGTAVLIWYRGERYVLSAAHVVELYPNYTYYIGSMRSWIEIPGPWTVNRPSGGNREGDTIDIAFRHAPNAFAEQLDGCTFLSADQQATTEQVRFNGPYRSKYVAIGYPLNAFKIKRYSKTTVPGNIAYAGGIASPDSYINEKLSATANLVLDSKWDSIVGEKGLQTSPKLEGISGGAIIRLRSIEGLGDLTRPQLAGITIEERRQARLLVGNRLGVYTEAINRARTA